MVELDVPAMDPRGASSTRTSTTTGATTSTAIPPRHSADSGPLQGIPDAQVHHSPRWLARVPYWGRYRGIARPHGPSSRATCVRNVSSPVATAARAIALGERSSPSTASCSRRNVARCAASTRRPPLLLTNQAYVTRSACSCRQAEELGATRAASNRLKLPRRSTAVRDADMRDSSPVNSGNGKADARRDRLALSGASSGSGDGTRSDREERPPDALAR